MSTAATRKRCQVPFLKRYLAPFLVVALSAAVGPGVYAADGVAEAAAGAGHAAPPGALEGRPAAERTSPLQARIDAARAGDTVEVPPGTYEGDLILDRPVRLMGRGRPRLVGSGGGSVVRIRAAGVTVEGFDIDGRGGGDLGRDSSGVHVAAHGATIRDCRIVGALFGIYLRAADGARVEDCVIEGIPGREPGEKGSGVHVWNTNAYRLDRNRIVAARDGFYIQSSGGGEIRNNQVTDVRYGIHYMFSDGNLFEDNTFENGAAGAALMFSKRIAFRRNRFIRNRGFASVGLLLKACDEVVAEDNLIADNARGIFLEGSYGNVLRRNVIAGSDVAIVLYDSCARNRFEGNSVFGNMTPLLLVGKRTDTSFDGNYWSGNDEPDLDGDGRSDRPYRLTSVFDHFRGNLTAADLLSDGPAAAALGAAETAFPILEPISAQDGAALVRPPHLPDVPAIADRSPRVLGSGLALSASLLAVGAAVLAAGRKGRP